MAFASRPWQHRLRDELAATLPTRASCHVAGLARDNHQVDGWSDLDLHLDLGGHREPLDLHPRLVPLTALIARGEAADKAVPDGDLPHRRP